MNKSYSKNKKRKHHAHELRIFSSMKYQIMVTISIDHPSNKMKLQKQNKIREVLGLLQQTKQKLDPFLNLGSSHLQIKKRNHFAHFLLSFNTP